MDLKPCCLPPSPPASLPHPDFLVLPLPCQCRSLWGPTAQGRGVFPWGTWFFYAFCCPLLLPYPLTRPCPASQPVAEFPWGDHQCAGAAASHQGSGVGPGSPTDRAGQGVGLVHPLEMWSGLVWWKEEQKLLTWSQGCGDRAAKFGAFRQSGEGER